MNPLSRNALSENVLLGRWESVLGENAGRPALLGPDGGTLRSFQTIEDEAQAFAPMLAGLPAGSVVAIRLGNRPALPALLLALFRARLIPVLTSGSGNPPVPAVCRASAWIDESATLRPLAPEGPVDWPSWRPDFLKLTSGTTAAPRLVLFRAPQLLADCLNICRTMGLTRADRNFGVIPFSHSYGFSNLITPLLACGIPLVVSDDLLPRAILQDLLRSGATVFPGMPVLFQKLAALETVPALSRLRLCLSAGAPLPTAVALGFRKKFGLKIHTFYGASECGGIAYDRSEEEVRGEGFAGCPLEGVEIGALPDGRIAVRSGAVGDGYFPPEEGGPLSDGCFVPGDLVQHGAAGLVIAGRVSDLINVAGRKLNPLEVEQELMSCPGVNQAVVFGVPSALRGEEPVACLVAAPGADRAEILRYCQARLSPQLRPKDLWLVGEIPSSERGKISRQALAALYQARQTGEMKADQP